jgi:hypothetical protein
MGHRSGWVRGGHAIAVLAVSGLAAYLWAVGLSRADAVAGVVSLLVAIIALVAPYLLPPGGRNAESGSLPHQRQSAQRVTDSVVAGHLTQARDVGGARLPETGTTAAPPATIPSTAAAPVARGDQYVNGVWVGGNLTQIDGTDGNITIG